MNEMSPLNREPHVATPPIPRAALVRVSQMKDATDKVEEIARREFDIANAAVSARVSLIDYMRQELVAAQNDLRTAQVQRDRTSPGTIRSVRTSRPAPGKTALCAVLYALTLCAWGSAMWQTAQWLLQSQIFDGMQNGALLMTGIVVSVGIGISLIFYSLLHTDYEKRRYLVMACKIGFACGLAWLASFVIAAWSQDQADFVTMHGSHGALLSLSALGTLGSLCKAIMLPSGIAAECAASVALEAAVSRYKAADLDRVFAPSPYFERLEQNVLDLTERCAELGRQVAMTEALQTALESARQAYLSECLGAHKQYIEARDINELLATVKFAADLEKE